MDKNYERNPEKAKYIKEQLYDKYQEDVFQKYEISEASLSRMQVCNLAEFLMAQQDKYERNRAIYERDENLTRIYVVADPQKDRAILINTNEKGKVPEGEFGTYYFQNDFQKEHFEISGKVKDEIVKHLGIGALPIEKQDEMINEILYQKLKLNELSAMDQLATMDLEKVIDNRIPKKEIEDVKDKYIDGENERNGKTSEERDNIEKEVNGKKDVTLEQESKKEIPEDVKKFCQKLGVKTIKGFFYVKANQLLDQIDDTLVEENGNDVLVVQIAGDGVEGPDKYYGTQDENLVLAGNVNKEIQDVTGNRVKNGQVLEPFKPAEKQYLEYADSNGLVIREELEDNLENSIQDISNYARETEEELEKYSQNVAKIKAMGLDTEQERALLKDARKTCNENTTKIANKYNMSKSDDQNIDAEVTEQNQEKIEEAEENEYDDEQAEHMARVNRNKK